MRFAIASEGRTDYIVLKNLLIGFFKDKNLPVTHLRPKDREPFGWGNLLKYISSQDFRDDCDDENIDYVIIQIDSNEVEEWANGINHLGDKIAEMDAFIERIAAELIDKIGSDYHSANKHKIIFAICVHEIECWLLPFNSPLKAQYSKVTSCVNALERIAKKQGFSINQKNYEDGKYYDDFSKEMKNNKILIQKFKLNAGLKNFIEKLTVTFPELSDK